MKRNVKKRLISTICCALALWMAMTVPVTAVADDISDAQARQEALRKENEELEATLDALREDEAKAREYQTALADKISVTEQKIDAARDAIAAMDKGISALEAKLEASRQEYQDTIDLFAERITALYKSGNISTLEILLDSSSLSDFIMRQEMLSAVARHDQQLMEKIEEYLNKTQADREELSDLRAQEAETKKEQEAAFDELEGLYEENAALLSQLEADEYNAQAQIAANEEEDAALEEQVQELIRKKNEEEELLRQQAQNNGSISVPTAPGIDGFSPCWPLPGYGVGSITGHFGDIYDNGPHNGLDIGANYGSPIVAAESGQVLSAEYHWSWGNNVLIWHNGTFSTRYAHMSSMAVSAGQYVEKGDVIGYVGSTGYAFGNHLHFEVYYNGVRVDPDPYLGI